MASANFASEFAHSAQSPLLFQGGNILCTREPRTGQRTLLVGEAEIARNTVLGLSPDQVRAAFLAEFGAERIAVLPAVSFHIDFDVLLRVHEGRCLAFVSDPLAAALIIARACAGALAARGLLPGSVAALIREGRVGEFLAGILPHLSRLGGPLLQDVLSALSAGAGDPGGPNFSAFLLSLDVMLAQPGTAERFPLAPQELSYLETHRRSEADRRTLRQELSRLGFRVIPVPSLSEQAWGATTLNGINLPHTYLMPTRGGLLADLEQAAQAVLGRHLPGTGIFPIGCAETQRRAGGPHCAASVIPAAQDR